MTYLKIRPILWASCLLFLLSCSKKTTTAIVDSKEEMVQSKATEARSLLEIPVDERVVMGTLPNGMKYYIQANSKPENRAELRLAVNAGSILEDDDQLGLAHFVEHMAFNGTRNFNKQELVDYLEGVGTRFGPDLNAYTSFDETVYMLQVRTDSMPLFKKGMLILSDWASGVSFEHQEIDKERGVVESEWRSRLSPDQRMQKVTFPVIYEGSRYADRLPIGNPDIINNADYSAIKRFYKDWYRPDLMAVVVVGDIDPAMVEQEIMEKFSPIPEAVTPRKREVFNVPQHEGTLVTIATDKEASFTNVQIMNKLPQVKVSNKKDLRSSLLRSAYNGMLNSRLEELSKEADPPFIFSYTGYGKDVGDIDSYTSFAMVPEGKAAIALERLMLENKRVLDHGFTQGELERQKSRMMEGAERQFNEMDKTNSNQLSMRYVYHYLDGNPIPSPKQMLDLYTEYLPTITVEEINALPQQWVNEDSRVVVVTGPDKGSAPLPTETEIRSLIDRASTTPTEPYDDEVIEGPLLDKALSPVSIKAESNNANTGIYELTLENGVQVFLKTTDFKNDEILLSGMSEGGSSVYTDEEYFNAYASTGIVMESGIGAFSNTQLEKFMAGKTANVSPYIGSYYEGVNGYASPKNVEDMFKMVYLYFTNVRNDSVAFDSYINKQLGIYENLRSNPNFYFSDYVNKLKYRNHPRVGFPSEMKWKSVDHKKALEMYKDRFADASDFKFTIVGAFDVEEMKMLAQKYLGNLPSANRIESWNNLNINSFPGNIEKRIKRGLAPKTQVEMYYHGPFEYDDDSSYRLSSMIEYMRIKLREELREDKGGVYGVGISGGGSKIPDQKYSITISFNSDPERVDELISAAKQVIQDAKRYGPDDNDLNKVKEIQRQAKIKNMKENRYWARQIENKIKYGEDLESILLPAFELKLNSLTKQDIKEYAKKYFNSNNYMQVVMDPRETPQN
jgi:zinc protease